MELDELPPINAAHFCPRTGLVIDQIRARPIWRWWELPRLLMFKIGWCGWKRWRVDVVFSNRHG